MWFLGACNFVFQIIQFFFFFFFLTNNILSIFLRVPADACFVRACIHHNSQRFVKTRSIETCLETDRIRSSLSALCERRNFFVVEMLLRKGNVGNGKILWSRTVDLWVWKIWWIVGSCYRGCWRGTEVETDNCVGLRNLERLDWRLALIYCLRTNIVFNATFYFWNFKLLDFRVIHSAIFIIIKRRKG